MDRRILTAVKLGAMKEWVHILCFNDTATTEIYTLSLHDALPICTRCMVTTAVGQKCPRCAKQTGRAKGNPEPQLLARAFGAGLAAAALGGVLLALAHGFVVGAAVRWAARRRTHPWLGVAAAVAVLVGLGGLVLVLGGNPFAARLLLAYLLSGGVAFARASGAW